MRLPAAVHRAHPWVIEQIAPDFRLLDAWALPIEGGAEDFDEAVDVMTSMDPAEMASAPTRVLFAVRYRLGEWFGWDEGANTLPIPGCAETSLRERLPEHLRGSVDDSVFGEGFLPVFRTDNEWAAELSNRTVHGVLQLGWVDQGGGRYRGQLGVYVKPRGRSGAAYLRFIAPFRHLVVYPALMRQVGRAWGTRPRPT